MTLLAWIVLALLLPPQATQPDELPTSLTVPSPSEGSEGKPIPPSPSEEEKEKEKPAALANWKKGQQALLEGQTKQAIALFQRSLEQDADLVCNHLSLAAAYLASGQEEQAAGHLDRYLQAQPEHYVVRGQYAELLLRLDRLDDAREQFERFEADIQDHETLAQQHMIHCHSQLMDIAATIEDEYARHLHRGIGLYWLARQRAELTSEDDDRLSSEGLLCQAASELVQARRERPDEARPCWYLHQVWSRLGQRQPATRWLRAAENAAPFSYLTPAEQRSLHLACRRQADDGSRK
ncbi:MAG TPA: tetratricopeptide repeat protein [Gemmataceae bacterium]|jgi:tetratricopeptide (TPR) repeat protein